MPKLLGGFEFVNTILTAFFKWWGTRKLNKNLNLKKKKIIDNNIFLYFIVCAKNSILTLAIFSWAIAGLMFGIQYLDIITDPVELWAAPNSRTRLEKDYFDSRFGPFFRNNQIFIKPINGQYVKYIRNLKKKRKDTLI